jgi:hypothetical protein
VPVMLATVPAIIGALRSATFDANY